MHTCGGRTGSALRGCLPAHFSLSTVCLELWGCRQTGYVPVTQTVMIAFNCFNFLYSCQTRAPFTEVGWEWLENQGETRHSSKWSYFSGRQTRSMASSKPQNNLLLIFNVSFPAQSWDLVQQTQNYLKLLISIINSDGKANSFLPAVQLEQLLSPEDQLIVQLWVSSQYQRVPSWKASLLSLQKRVMVLTPQHSSFLLKEMFADLMKIPQSRKDVSKLKFLLI